MANVPHWLVQSYATFDSAQIHQALAWTIDNMQGEDLAAAYRFARYYRPAMNRQNQYLVDVMGWKVQQQRGGSMAGYANYAPAMGGYNHGGYSMGMFDPNALLAASQATAQTAQQAAAQQQQQQQSSGGADVWGFLNKLVDGASNLLKPGMQNQPGSQFTPGGVTPGVYPGYEGAMTPAEKAQFDAWLKASGVPTTTTAVVPKPATTTPSWVVPAIVAAGAVGVAYVALKK